MRVTAFGRIRTFAAEKIKTKKPPHIAEASVTGAPGKI